MYFPSIGKKGELLFLIERNKLIWYSLAFIIMLILLLFTAQIVLCLELTLIILNRKSSIVGLEKARRDLGRGPTREAFAEQLSRNGMTSFHNSKRKKIWQVRAVW